MMDCQIFHIGIIQMLGIIRERCFAFQVFSIVCFCHRDQLLEKNR